MVKSGAKDAKAGIRLELAYKEGLTNTQRGELFRFYSDYFHLLATEAASANNPSIRVSMGSSRHIGIVWEHWMPEWKERRRQRLLDGVE